MASGPPAAARGAAEAGEPTPRAAGPVGAAARPALPLLFSEPLIVSPAAAFACFALFLLLVRGWDAARGRDAVPGRDAGNRIMGALAAGYTNANYIGIPVATYVLGNAALVVP